MANYNITAYTNLFITKAVGSLGLAACVDTGANDSIGLGTVDTIGTGMYQGLTGSWGLGDGSEGGATNENIRDIPKLVREAP